jgi:hypothetical protein
MRTALYLAIFLVFSPILTKAALVISISDPKSTGQKTIIKLDMKNTFSQKIEGAKGTIFLMDANGKVTGQANRWVVGGTKGKPSLAPEAQASYYFVVSTEKPFSKTQLVINRVVLEGGKLADTTNDVIVKEANGK